MIPGGHEEGGLHLHGSGPKTTTRMIYELMLGRMSHLLLMLRILCSSFTMYSAEYCIYSRSASALVQMKSTLASNGHEYVTSLGFCTLPQRRS